MIEVKENDRFILHSTDGNDYKIIIVSINEFREPSMKYALDVYNMKGKPINDDAVFVGEEFFKTAILKKIEIKGDF